jgi:hypothetical protein
MYEPYASSEFLAYWPYDEPAWMRLSVRDGGSTLLAWHAAMIRDHWQSLPPSEYEAVESWRARTYFGHNPIDQGPSFQPGVVLSRADEIEQVLNAS